MSLCLEYISRTKSINENLLTFPCTVMCKDLLQENPFVVAITPQNDKFFIERWKLNEFNELDNSFMPLKEDFLVDNVYQNLNLIFKNLWIVKYKKEDIPISLNRQYQPMEDSIYSSMFDDFLNSKRHNATRENFIWDSFLKRFHPELHTLIQKKVNWSSITIEEEKQFIYIRSQKSWNHWMNWKREFLKPSLAAPELIFGNLFKNTFVYQRF